MRSDGSRGYSTNRTASARRFAWRSTMLCALVLLSTSCSGWLKSKPETPTSPPTSAPEFQCREGNQEEWTGWFVLTRVAQEERAKGDQYHVAQSVEWLGGILRDCFPALFEQADLNAPGPPPAEKPAEKPAEPAAPPAEAKP